MITNSTLQIISGVLVLSPIIGVWVALIIYEVRYWIGR